MAGFVKTKGNSSGGDTIKTSDTAAVEIPAGGTAFLVKDSAAFTMRYGSNHAVLGEYQGSLSNDGEQLTLHALYGGQHLCVRNALLTQLHYQADLASVLDHLRTACKAFLVAPCVKFIFNGVTEILPRTIAPRSVLLPGLPT